MGKIEENKGAKTIVFYEAKLPFKQKKEPTRAKKGALIFQKTTRLCSARGLLETWESWERDARLFLSVVRAIASIRMGVPEACARPERRRSLHELPLARA